MKLQALASKPKLIKITIDDESLVKAYGEAIEFHIYDRQPMDVFMKLASLDGEGSLSELGNLVKEMILDEDGKKILEGDSELPVDVMMKVIENTVNRLGNSLTQTLGKSAQS